MTPIVAVAITVSDRCAKGEQTDASGPIMANALGDVGANIYAREIVSDDPSSIRELLRKYSQISVVNLIVTAGGTGFGPRDNTPEATLEVIEREAPGLAEAMRAAGIAQNPMAMLSRGVCGIANGTLIVNLPGSPKGVSESLAVIAPALRHAIELIAGHTGH